MSVNLEKMSVVRWYDSPEKHRCGYCKNQTGSISNGMWTETLTVEDYQNLIDRGWRRSGKYCYKPIMDQTCCPQYTIKCDVSNIVLSKSQKKIIKKFNRYLEDGILNTKVLTSESQEHEGEQVSDANLVKDHPNIDLSNITNKSLNNEIVHVEDSLAAGEPHKNIYNEKTEQSISGATLEKKSNANKITYKEGVGLDPSKPPCKKAKFIRLERKKQKLLSKESVNDKNERIPKQKRIEEFVEDVSDNAKVKLKLRLVPTSKPNSEWEAVKDVEFVLYSKYQTVVHNDPPNKLSMRSFCNFLVNSPLKPTKFPNGVEGPGFGSFHQQYWLDDKLIAVGVIDILPRCISSVYFFYDPDYRSLTLGTLGSLREVYFTRSIVPKIPELNWYYMGFYIHSCPKMRYKGKLSPSYLLCPETYAWIQIERCIPILDQEKYSRLCADLDALDENVPNQDIISNMKIVFNNTFMSFRSYKKYCKEPYMFEEIASLVGAKCAKSLVFWTCD